MWVAAGRVVIEFGRQVWKNLNVLSFGAVTSLRRSYSLYYLNILGNEVWIVNQGVGQPAGVRQSNGAYSTCI